MDAVPAESTGPEVGDAVSAAGVATGETDRDSLKRKVSPADWTALLFHITNGHRFKRVAELDL